VEPIAAGMAACCGWELPALGALRAVVHFGMCLTHSAAAWPCADVRRGRRHLPCAPPWAAITCHLVRSQLTLWAGVGRGRRHPALRPAAYLDLPVQHSLVADVGHGPGGGDGRPGRAGRLRLWAPHQPPVRPLLRRRPAGGIFLFALLTDELATFS